MEFLVNEAEEDEKGREGGGGAEPNTGVGKSGFTVLHMETIQIQYK